MGKSVLRASSIPFLHVRRPAQKDDMIGIDARVSLYETNINMYSIFKLTWFLHLHLHPVES